MACVVRLVRGWQMGCERCGGFGGFGGAAYVVEMAGGGEYEGGGGRGGGGRVWCQMSAGYGV